MESDSRAKICLSLGIESVIAAHGIIMEGRVRGADWLLKKGLDASTLTDLGYDVSGMRRLGFAEDILYALGYGDMHGSRDLQAQSPVSVASSDQNMTGGRDPESIRNMVAEGYQAADLRQAGVRVHHCKIAGISIRELFRLGFSVDEIVPDCSLPELKSAGFNPRELSRFFNGQQLRTAGFSASEMRMAGYGIKELLRFGYNENHVSTAGFSNSELARYGLTRLVKKLKPS